VEESKTTTTQTLNELKAELERLQSRLNAAKIAYLNRSQLDGVDISYEDVKKIAQDLIQTNYAIQKLQFGSVRLKLSVPKLIRRGR
jgi:hypothetical protein